MENFVKFLKNEIDIVKKSKRYRFLRVISSKPDSKIILNNKEVLNLCSNNYLGLAGHPLLINAEIEACRKYGVGSTGSRLITGTMEIHKQLEQEVAKFKNCEKAILFNTGYMANIGVLTALVSEKDAIFSDEYNHASIVDGCKMSKATKFIYKHCNMEHLETLLKKSGNFVNKLIVTDSVFSMDGDIAPLNDIVLLAEKYNAFIMTDDAHATGILGENGSGSSEFFNLSGRIHIQMGTFGKALGTFGAYIAGCKELIDFIINRARPLIYTTALPPGIIGATMKAIEIVKSDEGRKRRKHVLNKAENLRKILNKNGLNTLNSQTQIIPLLIGDEETVMQLSEKLLERGIFIQGIRPPTVPRGMCRLRISLTVNTDFTAL
jgi:8-amino-7-oxononanoate synthase